VISKVIYRLRLLISLKGGGACHIFQRLKSVGTVLNIPGTATDTFLEALHHVDLGGRLMNLLASSSGSSTSFSVEVG
jgi:hypothetical protein